jgi:hypothetical protein
MKLSLDSLDVQSFETSGSDTEVAATVEPATSEPQYHSKCYICLETDRTMCRDTCDDFCPITDDAWA